ncbi:MAG TPA: hypothetical protein DEP05_08245, partial [Betaproteobacteria bacterium]|nr:hypothetical protein [Betaproteobacteria bacterium]
MHKSMMAAEMRRDAALASLSSARADKRFVDNALRDGASGKIVGPLVLSVARFLATERSESIGSGVNVNMIG